MKPTKGPWRKRSASPTATPTIWEVGIEADGYIIFAYTYGSREQATADAAFIVAAGNAAREINGDDPIRAAEMMPRAIEALKKIANWDFDSAIGRAGDQAAQARELARRVFLDATDREGE